MTLFHAKDVSEENEEDSEEFCKENGNVLSRIVNDRLSFVPFLQIRYEDYMHLSGNLQIARVFFKNIRCLSISIDNQFVFSTPKHTTGGKV